MLHNCFCVYEAKENIYEITTWTGMYTPDAN